MSRRTDIIPAAVAIGLTVTVIAGLTPTRSAAQFDPQPEEAVCAKLLVFEEETNRTLPRNIDESTEFLHLKVNCETKTVSYIKRLLVDPSALAFGWKERKQRQYVQLHCNLQGLSSASGWNAMDVIFDPNYDYIVTLEASPRDCTPK